jgi:competence protein ComGC
MLFDHKGQGLVEYVIILSAILVLVAIIAPVIAKIGSAYERQGSKIDALP